MENMKFWVGYVFGVGEKRTVGEGRLSKLVVSMVLNITFVYELGFGVEEVSINLDNTMP